MCGSSEAVKIRKTRGQTHWRQYVVVCDASTLNKLGGCGTSAGHQVSRDSAIAAWNTRAAVEQVGDGEAAGINWPNEAELVAFGAVSEHFLACDAEAYPDIALEILARFRKQITVPPAASAGVPASEVFRIAGGDVEVNTNPTAADALECLRDLRACYDELMTPASAGVTEARLRDLVEAAQGFELIEHANETWLVFRSSVEKGLGAGSVRLDGPLAKDARARFADLRAALTAVQQPTASAGVTGEQLLALERVRDSVDREDDFEALDAAIKALSAAQQPGGG
jgi:hypothetical protein